MSAIHLASSSLSVGLSSIATLALISAAILSPNTLGNAFDITIEPLLKSGWQIAGYASSSDNRSTHILFKHPNETYLVQCSAGYDATRETRVFENCYKLK